ncbi:MAG: helix-turn-helix domain-containing protein [Ruminococcaceae bacterium]|nr:helix-turn-helix domain-containing protein [Oscillospiraceae bacterium]
MQKIIKYIFGNTGTVEKYQILCYNKLNVKLNQISFSNRFLFVFPCVIIYLRYRKKLKDQCAMKETMGQIIKKLRKERNLTQEDLAEQLGVTAQAISKWENDYGLPDISQVIPLATVFNVSTDVLFGFCGKNETDEIKKIIADAYSKITYPKTKENVKLCYDEIENGAEKYPNNVLLLHHFLEIGASLAYPESPYYDAENGESIYKKCIRKANIIIKNSRNVPDILRANRIMCLLHAAYGSFAIAKSHAEEFPKRSDMTVYFMKANISHFEKDYASENRFLQNDLIHHINPMIDDIVNIGLCYFRLEEYEKAEFAYCQALDFIKLICQKEDSFLFFHFREKGDIYSLLAEVYLKQGRVDDALITLEKMVNCDVNIIQTFVLEKSMVSPLLCEVGPNFYVKYRKYKGWLLNKLKNPAFDEIRSDERFVKLQTKASECRVRQ